MWFRGLIDAQGSFGGGLLRAIEFGRVSEENSFEGVLVLELRQVLMKCIYIP